MWDLTPTPLDMLVGFSHTEIGRAVVEFLVRKRYRSLGVVAGEDERSKRRLQAFLAAAQLAGLGPVRVVDVPSPTTLKSGRAAVSRLLDEPAVDAVFCSSDLLALGVLTEAQARGLRIPQQLAVVGFGDLAFSGDLHPALTTVRIDGAAIGRHASQFIVARAEGRDVENKVVDIGFSIIERDTA